MQNTRALKRRTNTVWRRRQEGVDKGTPLHARFRLSTLISPSSLLLISTPVLSPCTLRLLRSQTHQKKDTDTYASKGTDTTDATTDTETGTDKDTDTESDTVPDTGTDTDTDAESDTNPDTDADTDPGAIFPRSALCGPTPLGQVIAPHRAIKPTQPCWPKDGCSHLIQKSKQFLRKHAQQLVKNIHLCLKGRRLRLNCWPTRHWLLAPPRQHWP